MKLNRNDTCWCGSGKKYKQCHHAFDEKLFDFEKKGYLVPSHDLIKTPEEIEGIRQAGILNIKVLDMVAEKIQIGMSTDDINTLVHDFTIANGATPAPLGYHGFPKSVCTSLNDVVCHGIPSKKDILQEGDIINVDVTTILNGYYADASRMFCMGTVSEEAKNLVNVAKEALDIGLSALKPWGFLGDMSYALSKHVYSHGYTVVKDIGGHGVGIEFHEDPYVCHVGNKGTDMMIVPGMTFTIEPMVNMGKETHFTDKKNGWTIYTKDRKLSAQWEYTVLVTETGLEILAY